MSSVIASLLECAAFVCVGVQSTSADSPSPTWRDNSTSEGSSTHLFELVHQAEEEGLALWILCADRHGLLQRIVRACRPSTGSAR